MRICNAAHPRAKALAAIGIEVACSVGVHAEGPHDWRVRDEDAPRLIRVHVVRTRTARQWTDEALQKNGHYIPTLREKLNSEAATLRRVAATAELLNIPVGIVVRTYQDGGDDAA